MFELLFIESSVEKLATFALILYPSIPMYTESAPFFMAEFSDAMSLAGESSSTIFTTLDYGLDLCKKK